MTEFAKHQGWVDKHAASVDEWIENYSAPYLSEIYAYADADECAGDVEKWVKELV